jgi:membrane-anchored mycosin MYCP
VRNRYGAALRVAVVLLVAGCVLPAVPAAAAPAPPECGPSFTDQLTHTPWPLRRLQPGLAWPLSRGAGVRVAVIDSGITQSHPKLAGRVLAGTDLVPPGSPGDCDNSHGTLVASIIAGRDTKDAPFYGIAPDARIVPVRVLPNDKPTSAPDLSKRIADAVRYAVQQNVGVINLSLYTDPSDALAGAIDDAVHHNVVVVAAGGNTGGTASGDKPVYPAAYDGVLAVGGVDEDGKHVGSSTAGPYIDVAAPGIHIEGPAPRGGGYALDPPGGTSFAAAYVSGVAALLRAYQPNLSAAEVVRRIEETADAPPGGRDDEVGYGVVNPYRAVGTVIEARGNRTARVTGQVPDPRRDADPLATAKRVAAWVAPCGVLLAAVLLMARAIVVRGRRRDWRPGRG